MQWWHPVQAAVVDNLTQDFLFSASWLRHNQITLCYSERPYLTLEGKKFPFLREQEVQYNTAKSRFFGNHAKKNKLHKLTNYLLKGARSQMLCDARIRQ